MLYGLILLDQLNMNEINGLGHHWNQYWANHRYRQCYRLSLFTNVGQYCTM